MHKNELNAEKREVVGRRVKNLRKDGKIPANIYGKKVKSLAVSLEEKEFRKIYEQVGETGIVNLIVRGEEEGRPVLIKNIQLDPVTDRPVHIDLRQIILTEKISAMIPVELKGEPLAVSEKVGILFQVLSEIEIESLPADLPEKFVVDVSILKAVGDQVLVKDLSLEEKGRIVVKTDVDQVVAKIEPLAEEEIVPVPSEEAAVEGEAASVEEGKQSSEASVPIEENPVEEKKD